MVYVMAELVVQTAYRWIVGWR